MPSVLACPGGLDQGGRDGDEVVQMHMRDCFASQTRPMTELAGFKRLHLSVGERKTVTFRMKASQLAFLDREMRWKVEKGDFEILVGASSKGIHLKESFTVTDDLRVDGKTRGFWAEASVQL